MLAFYSFMNIVWFVIVVTFVFEDMEEWTDIGIGKVLAFEANRGDKILFMISIS